MSYSSALITGASSGIGAALAQALPAGTRLLLTGRDARRLEDMAGRLAASGRPAEVVIADLAGDAGRELLAKRAGGFGIDLLINNAGLGRFGAFAESSPAALREMVEVNVTAPLLLTRALLPAMLARARAEGTRAGLIFVASTAAHQPLPYFSAYAASKAFDLHFALALADELRRQPVDVLALCPGATATAFFERAGLPGGEMAHMASPEVVAARALAALGRRRLCHPMLRNRLTALASRHLPRRWTVRAAGRLMEGMLRGGGG